jgi:hypothetical protein
MTKYQAWRTEDGVVFFRVENRTEDELALLLSNATEFLFEIEAATGEEASAIYSLRMGFGPYNPMGEPDNCPNCNSWYYPQGSGECWQCGKIC